MENLTPRWQKWFRNLGWYVATLVVLVILFSFMRNFVVLLALWGVGLIWGAVLAYQFSQLVFGEPEVAVSEAALQSYRDKALSYQEQIDRAVKATSAGAKQDQLKRLDSQITTWTAAIEDLVQRLDDLRQNDLVRSDLREVPKAIEDLEKRLAKETDTAVQVQLERTLANRQKQLASLEALQSSMKRAEIQIESTLSMLGTIYSQILTGQSTSHEADYSRLSADVDEEVHQLEDHLEALREVKLGGEY